MASPAMRRRSAGSGVVRPSVTICVKVTAGNGARESRSPWWLFAYRRAKPCYIIISMGPTAGLSMLYSAWTEFIGVE